MSYSELQCVGDSYIYNSRHSIDNSTRKAFVPAIVGMSGQIHADFLRLPSIGTASACGGATRCRLSVHSLALPRSDSGDDACGGGTGTGAPGGGPVGAHAVPRGGGFPFLRLLSLFLRVMALMMPI